MTKDKSRKKNMIIHPPLKLCCKTVLIHNNIHNNNNHTFFLDKIECVLVSLQSKYKLTYNKGSMTLFLK